MREIKFRGWYGEKIGMLTPTFNGDINEIFAVQTGVYMQYTSLKDKNGREIYEGDIVNLYSGRCKAVVKLEFGCFVVCYSGTTETVYENIDDIEIIGNLYENPELLGE